MLLARKGCRQNSLLLGGVRWPGLEQYFVIQLDKNMGAVLPVFSTFDGPSLPLNHFETDP